MTDKSCQVCGGPVKNGRCKLCGMPNKRDEVLYHLNENREEKAPAQKVKTAPKTEKVARTVPLKTMKKSPKKEKKKNHGMKVILALLIVGIIFSIVDRGLFEPSHRTVSTGQGVAIEIYEISTDTSLVVGENLPAGTYTAVLEEGIATLSLKYGGETAQWNFKDGQREMELAVSDGVLISLYNTDLADRTLRLMRYVPEE